MKHNKLLEESQKILIKDWQIPSLHEENEERPYNYGRDEDDEGYQPTPKEIARAKKRREAAKKKAANKKVTTESLTTFKHFCDAQEK
tara:strand:+ start:154 stop:414 length:261 start_codon:yes stop_codon:yes gene_type:complete